MQLPSRFKHFIVQFPDPLSGEFESPAASCRGGVDLALSAFDDFGIYAKPSSSFHAVKERVDGAWSQPVSVPAQFLDDPETEYRPFCRMMQNVQSHESDV